MNAIEEMSAEHQIIERVIKSLSVAVATLDQGQRIPGEKLRGVVEFLRDYADQRHHQREEGLFFPLLVRLGVPAGGCPIGGLNNEHEKGRALVSNLEETIPRYEEKCPGTDETLRQILQDLVTLYEKHLWMEDAMVFPLGEKLMSEADQRELKRQFAELDRTLGEEKITRLEEFATGLSFSE